MHQETHIVTISEPEFQNGMKEQELSTNVKNKFKELRGKSHVLTISLQMQPTINTG